jgi:hypothetical protein
MAHYAYIDDTNTVVAVIVGKDENELIEGLSTEEYYAQGTNYNVKRTSFNNKIRYNFASVGFTYDPDKDAFIAPRPSCGHKELFLNDALQWNCQGCELEAKKLTDEA